MANASTYVQRAGESEAQAMQRISRETGRTVTPVKGSKKSETATEYLKRRQLEQENLAQRQAEFEYKKSVEQAKKEVTRLARVQQEQQLKERITNEGLVSVYKPKQQSSQLTPEQLKEYTKKSQPVRVEELPQNKFLSTTGGTVTEFKPTLKQRAFGVVKKVVGGETTKDVQISAALFLLPGGAAQKGAQRTAKVASPFFKRMVSAAKTKLSIKKSLQKSNIATLARPKTKAQAAVMTWQKTTTAGKITKGTARIIVGGVAGVEVAKLGTDIFTRTTTSKELKQVQKKYKKEYKKAQSEAYVVVSGGKLFSKAGAENAIYNVQPLLFEKTGIIKKMPRYKEEVRKSLIAQKVSEKEAGWLVESAGKKRATRQVAELPTNIFLESQSEGLGRKGFGWLKGKAKDVFKRKPAEKLGRFQLRLGWQSFKRQAPSVAAASTAEGVTQYYAGQRLYDQKVTAKGTLFSGLFGAVSGTTAQGLIQVPALNPKTKFISKTTRGGVEIVEGGNEFMGDVLATLRQKTRRAITKKPIREPVINIKKNKVATFGFQESPGRARSGILNTIATNIKNKNKQSGGLIRAGKPSPKITPTFPLFPSPTSPTTPITTPSTGSNVVSNSFFFNNKPRSSTKTSSSVTTNTAITFPTFAAQTSSVSAGGFIPPVFGWGAGSRGRRRGKVDRFAKELTTGLKLFRGGL